MRPRAGKPSSAARAPPSQDYIRHFTAVPDIVEKDIDKVLKAEQVAAIQSADGIAGKEKSKVYEQETLKNL